MRRWAVLRVVPAHSRTYSVSTPDKWLRREDPEFKKAFEHLNVDNLERFKGDFIRLPQLYNMREVAKGVTPGDLNSFFLTEDRLKMWRELYHAIGRPWPLQDPLNGTFLSGPNGVGKSTLGHFLVATAYANDWLVLYIPRCGDWARKLEKDEKPSSAPPSAYLLDRFAKLNASYVEEINFRNKIEHAIKGEVSAFDVQEELLRHIESQTDKPVLIFLDEHQQLFPTGQEDLSRAPINRLPDYFKPFTSWTRESGRRTFKIYSGSAHSAFERYVETADGFSRVRHVRPWRNGDFQTAVTSSKSPLQLPELEKNPRLLDLAKEVTGGVPRVLRYVRNEYQELQEKNPGEAIENTRAALNRVEDRLIKEEKTSIERLYQSLTNKDRFLDYIPQLLLPMSGLPESQDGLLYDKGLIYPMEDGRYSVVNRPARRVLLEFFLDTRKPAHVNLAAPEAGSEFEREVVFALLRSPSSFLAPRYYRQKPSTPSPERIDLTARDVLVLQKDYTVNNVGLLSSVTLNGGRVLVKPNFDLQGWDLIHHSVDMTGTTATIFIQLTIQQGKPTQTDWTIDSEHQEKIKKSMDNGTVAKILSALGVSAESTKYCKDTGNLVVVLKEPAKHRVAFCLISPSMSPTTEGRKPHGNQKDQLTNLLVIYRNELEKLGVLFRIHAGFGAREVWQRKK